MLITILFGVILFLALIQKNPWDAAAAIVFSISLIAHDVIAMQMNDAMYYISAGIFSFIPLMIISKMTELTELAVDLQEICLVSVLYNMIGILMYKFSIPPTSYNVSFALLYFYAVYILLKGSIDGGKRNVRIDLDSAVLCSYDSKSNYNNKDN